MGDERKNMQPCFIYISKSWFAAVRRNLEEVCNLAIDYTLLQGNFGLTRGLCGEEEGCWRTRRGRRQH